MPRYVVQRTFPEGLRISIVDGAGKLCRGVIERNAEEGVTWISSLSARTRRIGLAIGAASLPAAAQARFIEDAAGLVASSAVSTPSVQQQLDQLQSGVRQRFAAEGGWPSVASSDRSTVTSHGGFRWDDAGIGAAGMMVLLGTGAGAAGAMRRRRAQRAVIGWRDRPRHRVDSPAGCLPWGERSGP